MSRIVNSIEVVFRGEVLDDSDALARLQRDMESFEHVERVTLHYAGEGHPRGAVMDKSYLGDGAYVTYDGSGLWLTAEDGLRATNAVYLEPEVLARFLTFLKGHKLT